jgi:hypothetical protein
MRGLMMAAVLAVGGSAWPAGEKPRQLTPPEPLFFVGGPKVAATADLERWLLQQTDEQQRPAVVRLPFVVTGAEGSIGATKAEAGLTVRLDDSALGISLADRVRSACPGAERCAVWLEGNFGVPAGGERRFRLTRVGNALTKEERAAELFGQVSVPGARREVVALLDKVGSAATLEGRREAEQALYEKGLDVVPVLIAALSDGRVYEVRDIANRMNLPINAKVAPLMATLTVGSRCADLLYRIITPAVGSPPAGNFKVYSEQALQVADWRAFWAARRGKSLEAIHRELTPLVEAYWKAHGTTQPVP